MPKPTELLPGTRKAIAAGLPSAVALEALTIRAAELAGVGQALGSIETGKIANLVVSTGSLLSDSSRVELVFVDGEKFEVEAGSRAGGPAGSEAGGRAAGQAGGTAPASVAGTWAITTNSPQGAMEGTMTVQQNGNAFTGTMSSQMMGSTAISDGAISGKKVTWSITVTFGGQSFTISYAGEVEGTKMTGTVTAGSFGSFPFTAEKKP